MGAASQSGGVASWAVGGAGPGGWLVGRRLGTAQGAWPRRRGVASRGQVGDWATP